MHSGSVKMAVPLREPQSEPFNELMSEAAQNSSRRAMPLL
jgi:hypothetical protein